ncbi:esterase family protein [Ferruginibacter lapsinanis]|uniref:alpha/beta hydrolase n=1 Tax=Ferruginibacter lapsinanis TaxID=563172 RepID=UPI001E380C50|nr:alpha/beta hydrolase-fold protein [Ferruginibacter lapsinanis]UEG48687.1 esterase family protein [Ferruginibacter lapsinanis]
MKLIPVNRHTYTIPAKYYTFVKQMNRMKNMYKILLLLILSSFLMSACKKKTKEQNDEIYSRHLQEHIKLTIISTPIPEDKKELNLLLLNDGQDIKKLRVTEIVDSLFRKKLISPLIIVAIHTLDKSQEYGVAGYAGYQNKGNKADKYADFIDNELYSFIKKKSGVRKFKSVVIAGCDLGGLSAFDIAWDHADKIDKVGVFSGTFGFSSKSTESPDYSDNSDRIIFNKISSSRKKPHLKYWFYGDDTNENGSRYQDSITINHTEDLIALIKTKNVCAPSDIIYTKAITRKQGHREWSNAFPDFIQWAFGK